MKKIALLLIALCVAVFGEELQYEDAEKYLHNMNISVKEFNERCYALIGKINNWDYPHLLSVGGYYDDAGVYALRRYRIKDCKSYMKFIRKGCERDAEQCCKNLADEYNTISVKSPRTGEWIQVFGSGCSIRDKNEALKYYRKACELGDSLSCGNHTDLQSAPNIN